jgi:CRP-like cAMP-binding protein
MERTRAASAKQTPTRNRLLAALPLKDYEHLLPHLEPVSLSLGWVNHAGDRKNYLHFVTTGIVARAHLMENGKATAFAVTGNEGVLGVTSFLSGISMPSETVVVSAGSAYRLRGDLVRREFERHSMLAALLLRYTAALIAEIGQNAACNRHHSVDQQLCRWILSFVDRAPSKELTITQSLIGDMLGVRREGVTVAVGYLEKAGLIDCRRGHIAVLDRAGLEARSCECYATVRSLYGRWFREEIVVPSAGVQRSALRVSH